MCRRTHALHALTHRSCSSGATQARSEFCGAPPARASQVARSAAKGHAQQGRFFFGDFFLAKQKKVTRMPGDSRPLHSDKARQSNQPSSPGFDNAAMSGAATKAWKGCYEHERAKGLSRTAALNVMARKMVRVAFSLFKNHQRFDLALVSGRAVNA